MLIFIEIIGEYGNWTHSARFCLPNEAGFSGKHDRSCNISQVTKSDTDRGGRTAISEERMTILNKRKKAR